VEQDEGRKRTFGIKSGDVNEKRKYILDEFLKLSRAWKNKFPNGDPEGERFVNNVFECISLILLLENGAGKQTAGGDKDQDVEILEVVQETKR